MACNCMQYGATGQINIPGTKMVGGVEVPSTTPVGDIYVPQTTNLVGPLAQYGAGLDFLKNRVSLPIVGGMSVGVLILAIAGTYFVLRYVKEKKVFHCDECD